MESADHSARCGVRSLVIPEAVVRLTLERGEAHYTPLCERGAPLLAALAARLRGAMPDGEGLRATFPARPGDPALPDEERLRAPSVLDALRALAGLVAAEDGAGPAPGAYGCFSYELVDCFEELPPRRPDPHGERDAHFVLALDAIAFDHRRGEVRVVTRSLDDAGRAAQERHDAYVAALTAPGADAEGDDGVGAAVPAERAEKDVEPDVGDAAFLSAVEKFIEQIHAGDIFQGVLSRGLRMPSAAPTLAVYRELRRRNPSPYMFHVDLEDGVLLGASPETCIKVERGEVEIRPIAGTAPRGLRADGMPDDELDARLAVGLLLDRKEQAEHAMLVDLARNDVARVAAPRTRRVEEPLAIERYSHVQHLVSRVRGRLLPGLDALHAYRASANMGTVTGAPKLRAMELIREAEPFARGFYGGAVGYLLQDGSFDSCLVIRSLRYRGGTYYTRAGAGIVADSVPERELEETNHKARACRLAVAAAEGEVA
jgi:anthranilate synthase component 1